MALALPLIAGGVYYTWRATSDAQQFGQKLDKVNPVVTTQNVALGSVDTRILNSSVRMRHGMHKPEFFAQPASINVHGRPYSYTTPPGSDAMNYNRAFITEKKLKRMTPQGVMKRNTASDEINTTDMMNRKQFVVDTTRWPY